jgi:20S proteasome alpha/beta subunit
MTLVLALRCRDGVVLASDGQATSDAAGQPTRERMRKLFALGRSGAGGAAGSAGLQQDLERALAELDGELDSETDPYAVRARLAGLVLPIQQRAFADYVPLPGTQPPDLTCLFCWHGPAGPRIFTIPRTGSDHQFHAPYAAIGTGDIFAAFAMRSVAHLGTPELGLEQAKMVAYNAISNAIDVAAVYLGPPIQMWVVTPRASYPVPREELDGRLSDSVDSWKARQREALGPLAPPA